MPIVEIVPPDAPLDQGDILRNVTLFTTKGFAKGKCEAKALSNQTCMVISRPCSVAHKRHLVVAEVAPHPDAFPKKGTETLSKAIDFLKDMRDGKESPDVFYLGQIPLLHRGRFCLRLESLHTIQRPETPEELAAFLEKDRVGRLNSEFVRDLHVRIFGSYASLGFHDHDWLSNDDLNWVISVGKQAIQAAETAVLAYRAGGSHSKSPAEEQKLEDEYKANVEALKPYLEIQKVRQFIQTDSTCDLGTTIEHS